MGDFKPSIDSYEFLINKNINLQELNSKPFPFLLANTIEDKIFNSNNEFFQLEFLFIYLFIFIYLLRFHCITKQCNVYERSFELRPE